VSERHVPKSHPADEADDQPIGILRTFQKHQAALRDYIARFVRRSHDIDDIAQESFLRAYDAERARQHLIEHPRSFLFRIAHNVALKELRRKSNQIIDYLEEIDDSDIPWAGDTLEDVVIADQLVIGIHCEAVAQLPVKCRRVYLMRKVHGMSHQEIAERLNIAVSSVEKHISKGVRDCRRYVTLRQQGLDPRATREAIKARPANRSGGTTHG
jgi:RNA polymerase sigma factor (sigma-70 family)